MWKLKNSSSDRAHAAKHDEINSSIWKLNMQAIRYDKTKCEHSKVLEA